MNGRCNPARETARYDDIIRLPHPDSPTHPRMAPQNRASQFAPFAALTGYDAAIREIARLTEARRMLDEGEQAVLDAKLQLLRRCLSAHPTVQVTYFQPDARKTGGAYRTAAGAVCKLDPHTGRLVLQDGTSIPIAEIVRLTGTLFRSWDAPAPDG